MFQTTVMPKTFKTRTRLYPYVIKSCKVRCMCGRIQRVTAAHPVSCECGIKLSIETPYKAQWKSYVPWAELPENVPDGYIPDGSRAAWPYVAVVGK